MSKRVIVGLEPEISVNSVKTALGAAGAESIQDPTTELPDVVIVTIPSDTDLDEFMRMARMVLGVRYVEPDSWQFTA